MKVILLFIALVFTISASEDFDFTLHKKDTNVSDSAVLVIGGIQGDEPGGFMAASMLVTHYEIESGNLWVVPNLNFKSILLRSRGFFGDMNRKFAAISKDDPDYKIIQEIKSIITDKRVEIVLNLHDGSGFYRDEFINQLYNPNRWGQSTIIDQSVLESEKVFNLEEMAKKSVEYVNSNLLDDEHRFSLKNTNTRDGDKEMEKSLTYFAINNQKAAFGIETSKSFPTHLRVFYQLLAIEGYLKQANIKFKRNFDMTPNGVKKALESNIIISFADKISFDLSTIKNKITQVPLSKEDIKKQFKSNNPLVALIDNKDYLKVQYGNRFMTKIYPSYFEYDFDTDSFEMEVDGEVQNLKFGSIVPVKNYFKALKKDGYRVNVIGYVGGKVSEHDIKISKKDLPRYYSLDKKENMYRVEVYRGDKFSGMFVVDFSNKKASTLAKLSSNSFVCRLEDKNQPSRIGVKQYGR